MGVLSDLGQGTTPVIPCITACSTGDIVAFRFVIQSGAVEIVKALADVDVIDEHTINVTLTQAETLTLGDEAVIQFHYRLSDGFANKSEIKRFMVSELLKKVAI